MRTIGRKSSPTSARPGVAAGLAGGAVFIVMFLAGHPFLAFPAAAGAFILGFFLFSPRRKRPAINVDGITPEMFKKTLREGRERVRELEGYSRSLWPGPVREELERIRETAVKILDEIERDPADVKTARLFLSYYFTATIKVVKKYLELADRDAKSPEAAAALEKVENSLGVIRGAFDKQYTRLLENNVLDLDAEIEVLKKTIQMDGFGETEGKK